MYAVLSTIFSLTVLTAVVVIEARRQQGGVFVDAQCVTNWVFGICFGIAPIGVLLLEPEDFGPFDWALVIDRSGPEFACATGLGLIGLFAFQAVYRAQWMAKLSRAIPDRSITSNGSLVTAVVIGMLVIAALAALMLVNAVGGAWILIEYAMAFRSDTAPMDTEWLFLRNLVLFAVPASFLACGMMLKSKQRKLVWGAIFVVAMLLATAGLVHSAGRLSIAAYFSVFAVYLFSDQHGRVGRVPIIAGAASLLLFIVFGKYFLWVFLIPDVITETFQDIANRPAQIIVTPLLEFSFPVFSLANALDATPFDVSLRWFVDFPLAVVTLLPQRLLGIEQPMIIALVNAQLLNHPVPPDLLSTGYFSAGVFGVILMSGGLGLLARLVDTVFGGSTGIERVLALAWAFLIGFRVMYGDPTHAMFSGLGLIVCTFILAVGALVFRHRPKVN